jgi:acyl carrier protein
MELDKITAGIHDAFEKVLGHNNFILEDNTTAKDVDGWESITHMMIITEIENIFKIKFKLMDLMVMENINDLKKTINQEVKKLNV